MSFELPKLNFSLSNLEPVISKQTLEFHYGKHHRTYVNNLNNLISGTKYENAKLETIIMESTGGIFNNAAQVWNHTFYFNQFIKKGKREPGGKLLKLIDVSYGSFSEFKDQFTKSATTLFGSGWAWLCLNDEGKLDIIQESNAGNPMVKGIKPLLTCDVWEHAYYLDYQNKRLDYVLAFWDIIDWEIIESRLA